MARRKIKKQVYFHGQSELTQIANVLNVEIAASQQRRNYTNAEYVASGGQSGPRTRAGHLPVAPGQPRGWEHFAWLPVTRTVIVVADPNPHVCDWRCEGGAPGGECRCQCGGRNHGLKYIARGQFAA